MLRKAGTGAKEDERKLTRLGSTWSLADRAVSILTAHESRNERRIGDSQDGVHHPLSEQLELADENGAPRLWEAATIVYAAPENNKRCLLSTSGSGVVDSGKR